MSRALGRLEGAAIDDRSFDHFTREACSRRPAGRRPRHRLRWCRAGRRCLHHRRGQYAHGARHRLRQDRHAAERHRRRHSRLRAELVPGLRRRPTRMGGRQLSRRLRRPAAGLSRPSAASAAGDRHAAAGLCRATAALLRPAAALLRAGAAPALLWPRLSAPPRLPSASAAAGLGRARLSPAAPRLPAGLGPSRLSPAAAGLSAAAGLG